MGVAYVESGDEILLITQQGMILRMQTDGVRAIGRATQGVRLIDIEDDDRVVAVAKLDVDEAAVGGDDETESEPSPSDGGPADHQGPEDDGGNPDDSGSGA